MGSKQRQRREYDKPRRFAVASTQAIEAGDLLWRDDSLSPKSVKPASLATYASLAEAQAIFAAAFVGIAAQESPATTTGEPISPIMVHTASVMEFPCASATWEYGDLIGVDDNAGATALEDQQVIAVTDISLAIGKCSQTEATAVTKVLMEIFPPQASAPGASLADEFNVKHIVTTAEDTAGVVVIDTGFGADPRVLQITILGASTYDMKSVGPLVTLLATTDIGKVQLADGGTIKLAVGDVIYLTAKL